MWTTDRARTPRSIDDGWAHPTSPWDGTSPMIRRTGCSRLMNSSSGEVGPLPYGRPAKLEPPLPLPCLREIRGLIPLAWPRTTTSPAVRPSRALSLSLTDLMSDRDDINPRRRRRRMLLARRSRSSPTPVPVHSLARRSPRGAAGWEKRRDRWIRDVRRRPVRSGQGLITSRASPSACARDGDARAWGDRRIAAT